MDQLCGQLSLFFPDDSSELKPSLESYLVGKQNTDIWFLHLACGCKSYVWNVEPKYPPDILAQAPPVSKLCANQQIEHLFKHGGILLWWVGGDLRNADQRGWWSSWLLGASRQAHRGAQWRAQGQNDWPAGNHQAPLWTWPLRSHGWTKHWHGDQRGGALGFVRPSFQPAIFQTPSASWWSSRSPSRASQTLREHAPVLHWGGASGAPSTLRGGGSPGQCNQEAVWALGSLRGRFKAGPGSSSLKGRPLGTQPYELMCSVCSILSLSKGHQGPLRSSLSLLHDGWHGLELGASGWKTHLGPITWLRGGRRWSRK